MCRINKFHLKKVDIFWYVVYYKYKGEV
jgi:hypothetical protein